MSRLIEIYGPDQPDELRRLDEASLPLVVGSDASAHIRLPGPGGTVAYVGESRSHLFLQPAEQSPAQPIYHNDDPVAGSVWVKSGDTTRIGGYLLRWHLSGRRVEIRVLRSTPQKEPAAASPSGTAGKGREAGPSQERLHPVLEAPRQRGVRFHPLLLVLFLFLLACVAFVLLARPLVITLNPAPDRLSVSGFPPAVRLGERYLGLPGRYLLKARKKGYRPLEQEVAITSRGDSYHFSLQKLPGLIDVASRPEGATLWVDGNLAGETPLRDVELAPGDHTLRLEHKRYQPIEKTVTVTGAGQRQSLQVELQPSWALVSVQSEPAGASLFVDGEELGVTPLTLEMTAGKRRVVLEKKAFAPLEIDLEVEAGQDMSPPAYRLEAAAATVVVASDPSGATVTADGTFRGQTPLTLNLKAGVEHQIRLSAAGYLPQSRKLTPAAEQRREIKFRLEPEYGVVFIAATPPHATLYIDGKKHGQATGRLRLPTRAHSIELRASGYQSLTRTVTPRAGYSQRLEISLPARQAAAASAPLSAASVSSPSPSASDTRTAAGQRLLLMQPKAFLMGASRQEPGRRANESERRVVLQRPFYFSEKEVTNREYRQFQPQHASGAAGNRSLEIDSHPVVNVTWEDAARYLNWLSRKDGLPPFYREQGGTMQAEDPAGTGYRLPTEAEWAFVARMAGRKDPARYPWSGSYPPKQAAGNFADESARHLLPVVIEGYNDGFAASAPAGSFSANAAGIYDLGGNAAEWCHDYYTAYTGSSAGGEVDSMGPASGTHRVVRGSSWRDASITELRLSYRRYSREASSDIGFRIVRYAR